MLCSRVPYSDAGSVNLSSFLRVGIALQGQVVGGAGASMTYWADKVKEDMELHQVVLNWGACDDDSATVGNAPHLLVDQRAGILDLVTLNSLRSLHCKTSQRSCEMSNFSSCIPVTVIKGVVNESERLSFGHLVENHQIPQ